MSSAWRVPFGVTMPERTGQLVSILRTERLVQGIERCPAEEVLRRLTWRDEPRPAPARGLERRRIL